jgi:hypothetical protein
VVTNTDDAIAGMADNKPAVMTAAANILFVFIVKNA